MLTAHHFTGNHCTQQPMTAASYDGPVVTPPPPSHRRRRRCCRRCRPRGHRCRRCHRCQAGVSRLSESIFCPQVLRYATSNVRLLVPHCWDCRAYRLVWHVTKGGEESMIGGPDRPPSSPYFACFTQESARKLANP